MLHFAAIPRRAEHDRHLLEVVHEELSGVFAKICGFPGSSECVAGKQLELLRERRLRDAPASDPDSLISPWRGESSRSFNARTASCAAASASSCTVACPTGLPDARRSDVCASR